MADIFISYSRKDSEQALSLAEKLRANGFDVWIDQHGLEAATSWSKEIVEAIESSSVFVILLSESSLKSQNVVKELSIASEWQRSILPIELHSISLPSDFKYQLAGLQRAQYGDFDSILRALKKLEPKSGSGDRDPVSGGPSSISHHPEPRTQLTGPPKKRMALFAIPILLALAAGAYFLFGTKRQPEPSATKTIAVLPFESLSTDKENEYFADGMTGELIDMLVLCQELKVVDRKSVMEYKGAKQDIKTIAAALGVRYLVDGTIQRQASTIKISVHMTDAETGKTLLTQHFDGVSADLMALQEQIARSIARDLQLTFNPSGFTFPPNTKSAIPEANNLVTIAAAIVAISKKDIDLSNSYYLKAIELDPKFAYPYLNIARQYANLLSVDRSPRVLVLADSFFEIGKRLDTGGINYHFTASWLATQHKDFKTAIAEGNVYLQKRPEDYRGYMVLGLAYNHMHRPDLAADNWEEVVKRNPMELSLMYALVKALDEAKDTTRLKKYVPQAISLYASAAKRKPEDIDIANALAGVTYHAHNPQQTVLAYERVLTMLPDNPDYPDKSSAFYNAACANSLVGNTHRAMELLRLSEEPATVFDAELETEPELNNLRPLPEFQAFIKEQKARFVNK